MNGPRRFCKGTGIEIGSGGRHEVPGSLLVDIVDNFAHATPYHVDYVRAALDRPEAAYRIEPVPAPVEPGSLVCALRGVDRGAPAPAQRLVKP